MGFCKSNQKNIPVVGFLTRNDCDVLRAKTGLYKRVTHRTIIPPTTVNMFITAKECAPSKDAKNYHPSQRFGIHRREGDFREFLDHLPEEFQDDLKNKDRLSFFTKTVEFS